MIIFLNGSFGVGKTTVAQHLLRTLPNTLLYDPEEVGLMLRNILSPVDWSGDFQDYPIWRTLLVDVARMLKDEYKQTLIMPMTIWRTDYFKEVILALSAVDADLHHFCLVAPAHLIRQRLIKRGEQQEGDWVFAQIASCVSSFELDLFEERIDTSDQSPEQIAKHIVARIAGTALGSKAQLQGQKI